MKNETRDKRQERFAARSKRQEKREKRKETNGEWGMGNVECRTKPPCTRSAGVCLLRTKVLNILKTG